MQSPLNKVVFIQKVAAFAPISLSSIIKLAFVNNSWADTIKNYAFHLFEVRIRDEENCSCALEIFRATLKCDAIWILNALLCKPFFDRVNHCFLTVCEASSSLEIIKFVLDKIFAAGGPELLQSQLTATDYFGMTCLMIACGGDSSTLEFATLVFEKIVEAGGSELLLSQLTATTRTNSSCLLYAVHQSPPPQVVKLIFEKIIEVGGTALLKSQLGLADCFGETCLTLGFSYSSSLEVVKLIFEKVVEVGGSDMLQSLLTLTDNYGRNCFTRCCRNSSLPASVKLLAVVLFELDLFKHQYELLPAGDKEKLRKKVDEIQDASWVPDSESVAEMKIMLKR